MSQDPLEHIAEILRQHEVRPSANASFDEVMNRRKKKRRGFFWWFQRTGVGLLLLGVGSGIAYYNQVKLGAINETSLVATTTNSSDALRYRSDKNFLIKTPKSKSEFPKKRESLKENSKEITPNSKGSEEKGLFGLFQKFNNRRKNILGKNTKSVATGAYNVTDQSAFHSTKTIPLTSLGAIPEGTKEFINGGSPMSLSNVYDFGAKKYIAQTYFDFDIQPNGDEYVDWNFDLPSVGLRKYRRPWYVEFSAITGSDNQVQFDPDENMSVLGTNYMAQYQLSLLRECQGTYMWGMGLHYTQWVGNGEWRKREYIDVWRYDTTTVAINIPGLPTQYVTQLDSQLQSEYSVSTGLIKYQIDKISLPISFRGFTRFLKTNFRYAAQFSPGVTRITKGSYFTPTEFMPIDRTQRLSFGAKVGMGPIIPVGSGVSIVIEPSLMYESFIHSRNGLQGNVFGGLGISMLWRLK